MGDARFTYGYVKGALERRRYPLHLDVDIVASCRADIARQHNAALQSGSRGDAKPPTTPTDGGHEGDEMPKLSLPGIFESFQEPATELQHLPTEEGVKPGRYSFDLSKDGVFFLYGGKVPFVAKDVRGPSLQFFDHARAQVD